MPSPKALRRSTSRSRLATSTPLTREDSSSLSAAASEEPQVPLAANAVNSAPASVEQAAGGKRKRDNVTVSSRGYRQPALKSLDDGTADRIWDICNGALDAWPHQLGQSTLTKFEGLHQLLRDPKMEWAIVGNDDLNNGPCSGCIEAGEPCVVNVGSEEAASKEISARCIICRCKKRHCDLYVPEMKVTEPRRDIVRVTEATPRPLAETLPTVCLLPRPDKHPCWQMIKKRAINPRGSAMTWYKDNAERMLEWMARDVSWGVVAKGSASDGPLCYRARNAKNQACIVEVKHSDDSGAAPKAGEEVVVSGCIGCMAIGRKDCSLAGPRVLTLPITSDAGAEVIAESGPSTEQTIPAERLAASGSSLQSAPSTGPIKRLNFALSTTPAISPPPFVRTLIDAPSASTATVDHAKAEQARVGILRFLG